MYTRAAPPTAQRATQTVGALLGSRRRALDLSVSDVARRAGLSRATVERIERGDMVVSVGMVLRVVEVLDLLDEVAGALGGGRVPVNRRLG